jgi:hypothetical protein
MLGSSTAISPISAATANIESKVNADARNSGDLSASTIQYMSR